MNAVYEQFYGFKNAPFRLSPDPAFFFGSQGHTRALAYLRYGLNQKEGFIVITGAPGTGKTTLARALLAEVGRDKIIIAELNTTHLDPDDVLRMVAASFGLEHEGLAKSTLLKRLESFFISRSRAGYHVLLLVDEAQNLPYGSLEELRMLSNFYLGKDALIQIFLLGQEQFRNSLYSSEMEQLRQRVVASSHLEPLDHKETRDYIEHRLRLSGWKDNPKISDRAFGRIYSLTKGVPRRINTFCERLMLFGSLEELTEFHDDTVKAVAKELMGEISAKGVKLSDINPGVAEVELAHATSPGMNVSGKYEPEPQMSETQLPDTQISGQSTSVTSKNTPMIEATQASGKSLEEDSDIVDSNLLNSFSDEILKSDSERLDPKNSEPRSISQAEVAEEDSVFTDTTDIEDSEIDDAEIDESTREAASDKSKVSSNADEKRDNELDAKERKTLVKAKNSTKEKESHPLRVVGKGSAAAEQDFAPPHIETPVIDTKPDWWELVALAVAYHHDPNKFKSLTSSKTPIPTGVVDCFKIAIGKMIIPDYLRTGILAEQTDQGIREALRFYIKMVFLSNTADYYRRLGVSSDASFEEIRTHYKYLFRLFQPDKEQTASNWDETFTRRINQSYGTLRSTDKRKEYDEFLIALQSRKSRQDNVDGIEASDSTDNGVVESDRSNGLDAVVDETDVPLPFDDDSGFTQTSDKKSALGFIFIGVGIIAVGAVLYVMQSDIKALISELSVQNTATTSFKTQIPKPQLAELVDAPAVDSHDVAPLKQVPLANVVEDSVDAELVRKALKNDKAIESNPIESKSLEFKLNKPVTDSIKDSSAQNSEEERVVKSKVVISSAPIPVREPVPVNLENSVDVQSKRIVEKANAKEKLSVSAATSSKVIASVEPTINKTTEAPVKSAIVEPGLQRNLKPSVVLPKSKRITQKRLSHFVTEFSLAYEEGNVDAFMTFFAEDASTNEASNKLDIRKDYEKLFASTEMRVINLDSLKWKIKREKAVGKGDFDVTVLGAGAEEMKKFSGLIKLEVVNTGDKMKLKGMFHAYGTGE